MPGCSEMSPVQDNNLTVSYRGTPVISAEGLQTWPGGTSLSLLGMGGPPCGCAM